MAISSVSSSTDVSRWSPAKQELTTLRVDNTTATSDSELLITDNITDPLRNMAITDIVYVSVVTITSLLSIPSCLAIITMYIRWTDLRNAGRSMLLQLSVADMLTATGNLMGVVWYLRGVTDGSNELCRLQSTLNTFSTMVSFLWNMVTALSIFLVVVRNVHDTINTFWKPIWLLCWGVPAVITATALSLDVLGYDPRYQRALWCWISSSAPNRLVWNFMAGKAWELLTFVVTAVLYTAVRINLIRHKIVSDKVLKNQSNRDRFRDASLKLMFLPGVFIFLRLWGTLRFLLGFNYAVANSPYVTWIVLLQGFGDTAQGFCNFLLDVIFTPNVRRRLFYRQAE